MFLSSKISAVSLLYSNPALPAAPGYALYSLPSFLGADSFLETLLAALPIDFLTFASAAI
jgi:hypothetical protein